MMVALRTLGIGLPGDTGSLQPSPLPEAVGTIPKTGQERMLKVKALLQEVSLYAHGPC